jgi:hypothetical protein
MFFSSVNWSSARLSFVAPDPRRRHVDHRRVDAKILPCCRIEPCNEAPRLENLPGRTLLDESVAPPAADLVQHRLKRRRRRPEARDSRSPSSTSASPRPSGLSDASAPLNAASTATTLAFRPLARAVACSHSASPSLPMLPLQCGEPRFERVARGCSPVLTYDEYAVRAVAKSFCACRVSQDTVPPCRRGVASSPDERRACVLQVLDL